MEHNSPKHSAAFRGPAQFPLAALSFQAVQAQYRIERAMEQTADTARDRLRATHNVRLVESHEEGTAAADLPVGVYGFTGSPGLAAPLFATKRYRNFEVHHHASGVAIIGFVTPRDCARVENGAGPFDLTIYPDPDGDATAIVAIGYSQIAQHRQYSVRGGAGLMLRIRPQVAA